MDFPKHRILSTQQLVRLLRESGANGERFCFILGSGASVESGIPTGNQLEMRWMNCLMGDKDDWSGRGRKKVTIPAMNRKESVALGKELYQRGLLQNDPDKIIAAWENVVKNGGSLSSEYYFDIYKWRFYPSRSNGYRYLEREMEDCEPSIGYHTLALLLTETSQNNLVITTNFDNLVEDALFLYTNKKPLVVSHESLACYIESDIQRPIVAKVHRGLMYAPFNSPETTSDLKDEWRETLAYAFNTYTPIVIGYGGGDHSLMAFLEASSTKLPRGIYWCYRDLSDDEDKSRNLPGEDIRAFVEKKDGHFVRIRGFDALMLEIGEALYKDLILPGRAAELLKERCESRTRVYNEQWDKLKKNASTESIVDKLNQDEKEAADTREKENKLTDWDCFRRGYDALNNKQYGDAIMWYTKAIELNSEFAGAYNNRGNAYAGMEEYAKALADYNKAIALDPELVYAYNGRGNVYQDMEEYAKALADYNKAIALDPEYAIAYNGRGNVYYDMKEYAKALADYEKAIALDSEYTYPYRNRGIVYNDLERYEDAVKTCTIAIELDPTYKKAYQTRAEAYRAMGEEEKAKADEQKAAGLD